MAEREEPENIPGSSMLRTVAVPEKLPREEYWRLAEQAKESNRLKTVSKIMEKMVVGWTPPIELTSAEMLLLAYAYNEVYVFLRKKWCEIAKNEIDEDIRTPACPTYNRSYLESEIWELCCGILKLLDERLLPTASTHASKVFYLKMKGDFNRHLTELASMEALESYNSATTFAAVNLHAADPEKLRIAINWSLFYHDVLNLPIHACSTARRAIDDANGQLPSLRGQAYEESNHIVNALKNNLTKWTAELQGQSEEA